MKKRALLIAALTAATLMACGGDSSTATDKTDAVIETAEAEENDTAEEIAEESDEIAIEEQEIYNDNGIVITATGLVLDGFMGPELTLLIENNSDKNITVQTRNSSVNGYMMDLQMSCDVVAGKKANDEMSIMESQLEQCGIDSIADIEFNFHFFDTDTYENDFDSDMITLKTTIADNFVQEYDDSGDVLYENNGLKIVSKGLVTDDSIFGPEYVMYFHNTSDRAICVQARDTSVNGFMVDPSMSADILPGKHAVDEMTFMSSQLEENKIETIEEIETSFHIFDAESWDDIEDTEPITISFK